MSARASEWDAALERLWRDYQARRIVDFTAFTEERARDFARWILDTFGESK